VGTCRNSFGNHVRFRGGLAKKYDNIIHTSNFHLFINGVTYFSVDINRPQGHINLNEFVPV
jgi:hypothetical protein